MNHFTPFMSPDEIAKVYCSADAPRFSQDGNTNVPINLTTEDLDALRDISHEKRIPMSWLIRYAVENMYRPALEIHKRRYE